MKSCLTSATAYDERRINEIHPKHAVTKSNASKVTKLNKDINIKYGTVGLVQRI